MAIVILIGVALSVMGCASEPMPTLVPIRDSLPTLTPRNPGTFGNTTWLFGTATPSATPTFTATPGPSPTPTVSPTPLNRTTLTGQLLFLSSRKLPSAYGAGSGLAGLTTNPDLLKGFQFGSTGQTVWRFDPMTYRIEPCDPPPSTPTPMPAGTPTRAFLFGDMGSVLAKPVSACQVIYEQAQAEQTLSSDKRWEVYVGADASGSGRPQIWVIDHQTNLKKMVTTFGSGVSYDPVIAPDGYHIAFISQELRQDNLYTITRDGNGLRRLTRIPGQEWNTTWEWIKRPTWSLDGTQIAFWSNKVSGARQIWIVNADGTNLHAISNDPRPAEDYDPVWIK